MDKQYIDNFYNNTLKAKEYEVFAFALPITLLHKQMFNATEQLLKTNYNLLHSHIDVLASLYFNNHALSPTELYNATLFSSGGMTKVLKKLEEKEYIKRVPCSKDKRSLLVCLTPKGSQLVEKCLSEVAQQKEQLFKSLSIEEKEILKTLLSKLTYGLFD